jgi:hypothetical protein
MTQQRTRRPGGVRWYCFVGDFALESRTFTQETMTRRESRPHFKEELMIEMLKGFPDNVVAFAYHGQVTKAD